MTFLRVQVPHIVLYKDYQRLLLLCFLIGGHMYTTFDSSTLSITVDLKQDQHLINT